MSTTVTDDCVDDPKGPLGLTLLHSPPDPLIELVFVHGLGGGSRKTWSKTSFVAHYWPQEWIPKDPAFKDVRIHSFGYDSDWAKGKENCLNIHHFGKSLLGELSISPCMKDSNTAIVLVGHSMGGLVIKKAHILARQDGGYENLAKRFHTIYFLATPHKGSASAKILKKLLQITNSSPAYVAELERGSSVIRSINNEFLDYSNNLRIWSFYETQKLKIGFTSTLIVEPESAILGCRGEKQMPMNADHRSICKFETRNDANYVLIRNSLATTVQAITESKLVEDSIERETNERLRQRQLSDLAKYLQVPEDMDDDLANVKDVRLTGTCEWFIKKESYQMWRSTAADAPQVLWVSGRPAAGKSVLAGYVIDQLLEDQTRCSYYFFKYGDEFKSRLSTCLRSLVFQMACKDISILELLTAMQREGKKIDNENERSIWRTLSSSGILRAPKAKHYWVIDALDECGNASSAFGPMLTSVDPSTPIRIMITSRELPRLEQELLSSSTLRFQHEKISIADTRSDIELLVERKVKSVNLESSAARASLVERIMGKSEGTFLWTVLVLNDLSNSYGEEEISSALEDMPRHMSPLYHRILETMNHTKGGKKLAQTILTWATCAIRPLTTKELGGALKIDIRDTFPNLEQSILAVCGHLVTVDKLGKVQLVHGTARDFLLDTSLESEFAISPMKAHTNIAKTCLTYLNGEEMKPPRTSRRGSVMGITSKRAEFSTYACAAFSYHLSRADPLAHDVLLLIDKFLKANVLSWIEVIAQTQNLTPLIRAAKNLRKYARSTAAATSPLGAVMHRLRGWSVDFVRVVAKFGDALAMSPLAIYSHVLPFCPLESAIHDLATPGRGLSIFGLSNIQWDDRFSCIDFRESVTSALCYGDELFAIGLLNGAIVIYHAVSCQEFKSMTQGESVRFLRFKTNTGLLASCGIKAIRVWDIYNGTIIHSFQASQRIIGLTFHNSDLIATLCNNCLVSWDVDQYGSRQPDRPWSGPGEDKNSSSNRVPCAVSLSLSHQMLAVAYNGRPIILWDIEEDAYYGECGKKLVTGQTSTHMVTAIVFNPNPNIELMATSYLDGDLVILDPFNDQQLHKFRENCHTLAASPDGRLLAGGAGGGLIQIYEFDTLRLLYRVKSSNMHIKQLAFSSDGLHLCDIRGSHCNVWEPAVLLGNTTLDDSSESTSTSVVEVIMSETKVKICTMCLHPKGDIIFCGKDDGSISIYELQTGSEMRTLYRHKSVIRLITWWHLSNTIMTVDASNGIMARKLKYSTREGFATDTILFQSRLNCEMSVIQLLQGERAGRFILSTRHSDHMWNIGGEEEAVRPYSESPGDRKWLQHPQSEHHMICIGRAIARIFTWKDWTEVVSVNLVADFTSLHLKSVILLMKFAWPSILIEMSELDGSPVTSALHLFDLAPFSMEDFPTHDATLQAPSEEEHEDSSPDMDKETAADPRDSTLLLASELAAIVPYIAHVLGCRNDTQLVFLDTKSWVSSADLEDLKKGSGAYFRHFFVPYEWFAGMRDLIGALTQRDVIFARYDEVAIIRNGLQSAEPVNLKNIMTSEAIA